MIDEPTRRTSEEGEPEDTVPPEESPAEPKATTKAEPKTITIVYRDTRADVYNTTGASGSRYRFRRLVPQAVPAKDAKAFLARTREERGCCGASPRTVKLFAAADN